MLDFPPKRLASLKNMVPHGRRRTAEHLGDLGGVHILHLSENESRSLLGAEGRQHLGDHPADVSGFGDPGRRLALADNPQTMFHARLVSPIPTLARPQEIDRDVGADSVDPGRKTPTGVVPVKLAPGLDEGHLNDIPGFLFVIENPGNRPVQPSGMATNQSLEGSLVSFPGRTGQASIPRR